MNQLNYGGQRSQFKVTDVYNNNNKNNNYQFINTLGKMVVLDCCTYDDGATTGVLDSCPRTPGM